MTDERTKRYFKLLRKNEGLFGALLKNKASKGDGQTVALCLTEVYFRAQHLIVLIKKFSEANLDFTENSLDPLLGNLVDLQVEIYIGMLHWIRDMKRPLKAVIDNVEDLGPEKKGTGIARKNIRSSMKQMDDDVKKIRYYSAHNNQSKKRER